MMVKEVSCRSVLSRSGISSIDYAVNPYTGCFHKCVYCYARFMKRFTGHKEDWGDFVDIKINAPQVLAGELSRAPKGFVGLSTVTDPYQPLEKRYGLTRKCLQELLIHDFPITVQTKSPLVLRDIDLFTKFSECEVGFTITTVDDEVRRKYELRSSPVEERLAALRELYDRGIPTFIFLGPILPCITDTDQSLRNMIQSFAEVETDCVMVDRLNLRWGVWAPVIHFLKQHYPDLIPAYKRIFWSENDYFEKVKMKISRLCNEYGVKCEFCY